MNLKSLLTGNISQDELLNYYNAKIIYVDIPYETIRGFVDSYNGINFIYINKNMSYYKRKKTIIHELAHIELNQLNQIDSDLFAFKRGIYEDEADRYIEYLLENINNG